MAVTNLAELDALVARVKEAQREFASFSQEQVDKIFRAAALAANNARIPLAQMAVEESGMGIIEDKVIKNHFASEYIYNKYKDEKTCGILSEDDQMGTITIAEPVGIICGIVPTTNPTSTAIFKSMIALKTRNAIIFSRTPVLRTPPILLPSWYWMQLLPLVHRKTSSAGSTNRLLSSPTP